jgi:glycerophosphoinositol inositolphosphodiesterase
MNEHDRIADRLKIKTHYFLALILLIHALIFMVYWVAVGNFRGDVDHFIGGAIGWSLPYTAIIIGLSVLVLIWSLIRFFKFRYAAWKKAWKPSIYHWVYFGVWVLFLIIFYLSFAMILRENPSQWGVVIHLLNLVRLAGDAIIFLFAAIWLRRLILFLRGKMMAAERKWGWTVLIIFSLVVLIGLWLIPTIFPPNWAYQGDLPPKPALIAHRGASMLAPENTLASAKLAADLQAFGFETDLRITLDGELILMHDETLERTTNIAEVFPERTQDLVSSFTLSELNSLNAGLWFIQKDPFDMIEKGLVSQAQLSINQGQKIPTFNQALELVKREGLVILFDLRYPPEDHPYYGQFFDLVLQQCRESGMNGDIWFLVSQNQRQAVISQAPQMTRIAGVSSTDLPSPGTLLAEDYEIVNVDTGIRARDIQAYRKKGLGVNVYTIDQSWLFSQFWLSGVTSVTTNNIQTFSQLDQPLLNLPYSRYLLFWGVFGIIVAIWLASSQPEQKVEEPRKMDTPDLLDFAQEREENLVEIPLEPEEPKEPDDTSVEDVTQVEESKTKVEEVADTPKIPAAEAEALTKPIGDQKTAQVEEPELLESEIDENVDQTEKENDISEEEGKNDLV